MLRQVHRTLGGDLTEGMVPDDFDNAPAENIDVARGRGEENTTDAERDHVSKGTTCQSKILDVAVG